ncbi:MAG: HipA domain-containing protein [Myxococcota bacterium]
MPRSSEESTRDSVRLRLTRGPCDAAELQRSAGRSKSSVQRGLDRLRGEVLTVGHARATRYALRRGIAGVVTPTPVFEFDPDGAVRHALTLHPVEPFGFWVEAHVAEVTAGFEATSPTDPDLPWWLADARPQGFLGRGWARTHADAGYPLDVDRWSADQVLRFLAHYGADVSGAFAVGTAGRDLSDRLSHPDPRPDDYPALAQRALTDGPWGSSAGGDQPKFQVAGRIVKFSPPIDQPLGRRWADLLAAEHHAHEVLDAAGVPAARSTVFDLDGRRFLEVHRFDRHGPRGRSGLVSLASLDPSGVARELRSWSIGAAALARDGRLDPADVARVAWLEAFGHAIANTDMHPGNLSFRLRGTTLRGLAPVYDVLPMFYAPRHGELPTGLHRPAWPAERAASALAAARTLWERVAADPTVSDPFRRVADHHAAAAYS